LYSYVHLYGFKAQQAAAYAVKALLKGPGVSAYGHSIVKLLKDLETCSIDVHTLTSYARTLDRHYVPARYPDAFTEGSTFEFYIALDSLVEGKLIVDDGFWEIARIKFEEVKKRYELMKEPKRWVSMGMKRSFLKEHGELIPAVPV